MTLLINTSIEFLVRGRFPDVDELREWVYSEAHARACPAEDERRLEEIDAYVKELSRKPPAELQALVEEEKERRNREAFYNQPHANADVSYWSKMPCWELDEAVALLGGDYQEENQRQSG